MKPLAFITIGIPGSGKSTWAQPLVASGFTEINLDDCREAVSGDASDQSCTMKALQLRDEMLSVAMARQVGIVISDTNLVGEHREVLMRRLELAGYQVVPVIFDVPFDVCQERNKARSRVVPDHAMERMQGQFEKLMESCGLR